MGNRAVICLAKTYEPKTSNQQGVYIHWNGGYDSVEAFLTYCKLKGYTPPEMDCYGWARLCQVIGNFFGGSLSIGIDACCKLDCDNGDNGTYLIQDWEIVGRKYHNGPEQHRYNLTEMLIAIDQAQPVKEQLGKDFFLADEVPISEIKIGDEVYMMNPVDSTYKKCTVVGFGDGSRVNGLGRAGIPYVNQYGDEEKGYAWNPNNYIMTNKVRRCKKREKLKVRKRNATAMLH